jgi:hypothetical protein
MRSVLQASGARALHLLGVGDLNGPAVELQSVVDEAGTVHRFDDGEHLLVTVVAPNGQDEGAKAVNVRWRRPHFDGRALLVEEVHVEAVS